jgi:hypothetical protein
MTDSWQDLLSEEMRRMEAENNPPPTSKALALLRVIRVYELRARRVALRADYRLVRKLPRPGQRL